MTFRQGCDAGTASLLTFERNGMLAHAFLAAALWNSIVALPPKCPELNPVENIWQFMRENWIFDRIFTSHDNIVDHCCEAWIRLIDQSWHIMTIGRRR